MALKSKFKTLTAALVRNAKEPGRYYDNQRTGLFLEVRPNLSRFWLQRIVIHGKRRELGLGSPPFISLAEAREQAFLNKKAVRDGGDPLASKRERARRKTFEEAARLAHVELSPTWKNPKDRAAFLTSLEKYIFPQFGDRPLAEVSTADVRKAILLARDQAPGVAKKLIYRVSAVFKWGIAEGLCANNPSFAQALALPRMEIKAKHRKALPYAEVADCIRAVSGSGAWLGTKLAFEFVVLSACRSGEVRAALRADLDLHGVANVAEANRVTWEIPAERMKMKRPHRVPLSKRAIAVLAEAERIKDRSGLIFPSSTGKVMSDMTLSKLVKSLGFDADVHGFRTSFRTWVQEQTDFPREVAEAALAHKVGDTVEQAYARSDVLEKRREMMESWAVYLAG